MQSGMPDCSCAACCHVSCHLSCLLSVAAAIIKRVLLVILAAVGLGTALFFVGLEYLFPKY
jgi:hypothetical protein